MILFCTCSGREANKRGFVADPVDNELWVHAVCRKPSRMVFQKMTYNRTPRGATAILSYAGRGDGSAEIRFSLPDSGRATILTLSPYDRRPYSMPINPTDLLLSTWERLDHYVKQIMEPHPPDMTAYSKGAARAIAEVLAPMMYPFFETPDDIVREAMQRYEQRDNADYETPGLGQKTLAQYDNMPNPTRPSAKPEPELSEKEINGIKMALSSGMFPIKKLAETYGVSEATIKSLAE